MSDSLTDARKLLSSAGLVFIGSLIQAFSRLGERIIIGRSLSPDAYGEVTVGITIMIVGSVLAMVGVKQGLPQYLSRVTDSADLRGMWFSGTFISICGLSVIISILVLFEGFILENFFELEGSRSVYRLFVISMVFYTIMKVAVNTLRGLENTKYRTYIQGLLYPISRIGTLVFLLSIGYGVVAAGYAYLLASVVSLIGAHIFLNKLLPVFGKFNPRTKDMFLFSLPLLISGVLTLLLTKTDTLMVSYFRSSTDVGLYNAAFPIANSLVLVLSSFGFLYLPMASRLDSGGKRERVSRMYRLSSKWIYILTFPLFALLVTFPEQILRLFFGDAYSDAAVTLVILSIGIFINVAAGRSLETFAALGKPKFELVSNSIAFTLNLILNVLLIPIYGIIGAAIASAAAFAVLNIIAIIILSQYFGIYLFSSKVLRTYLSLPLVILPLSILLSGHVTFSALILILYLPVVGIASLVVVLLAKGFSQEDRVLLDEVLEKIGVELW